MAGVAGVPDDPHPGESGLFDRVEFDRWRAAADEALRGAELQAREGLHGWACFLAEQSAQLTLKGLLHGIGAGPWGHDLVRLGQALAQALEAVIPEPVEAALRRLSRHYIPARYPDAHPSGTPGEHYGPSDSQQALADVSAILEFADALFRELLAACGREAP